MFLTRKIESNFLAAIFLFFFFPSSRYDKNLDDEVEKEEKRKERETRIFSAERREKKLEERGKKKNYRKIRSLGRKRWTTNWKRGRGNTNKQIRLKFATGHRRIPYTFRNSTVNVTPQNDFICPLSRGDKNIIRGLA